MVWAMLVVILILFLQIDNLLLNHEVAGHGNVYRDNNRYGDPPRLHRCSVRRAWVKCKSGNREHVTELVSMRGVLKTHKNRCIINGHVGNLKTHEKLCNYNEQ